MMEAIDYTSNLVGLRRVEGQIRGIQRMIGDHKCAFDVLTQVHAVKGALAKIEREIFAMYLQQRTVDAEKETPKKRQKTIDEILTLIHHTCRGQREY
jgi:DNA-binding FrmR family transcriptional regulator